MGLGSTVRVRKDILQSEVRYLDVSLDIFSPVSPVEFRATLQSPVSESLFTFHQRVGMMGTDKELWTYLDGNEAQKSQSFYLSPF